MCKCLLSEKVYFKRKLIFNNIHMLLFFDNCILPEVINNSQMKIKTHLTLKKIKVIRYLENII